MRKIDFEEYIHNKGHKRNVKRNVAELASCLEKILFDGKKWVAIVVIPTIEILLNILTLLEDRNDHDDDLYF